ncbi:hypothetical protein AB870_10385 [Pandoraea faecigallinarum]|nr:hypothetical protein AB870_10385 [Pandoraea faecigallinarum]
MWLFTRALRAANFQPRHHKLMNASGSVTPPPPHGEGITDVLIYLYIITFPALSMLVRGGASALLIGGSVLALFGLFFVPRPRQELTRADWTFLASMAAPVVLVVATELSHGEIVWNTIDSPSRFLLAIPLYLLMRRHARPMRSLHLAFMAGAIASILIMVPNHREWGADRFGSYFLNPIHYGDIALIFGVLSALSVCWGRRDHWLLAAVKISGLIAGLLASLLTGSRGGWVALPLVAILVLTYQYRTRTWRFKTLVALGVAAACMLPYAVSPFIRDRVDDVKTDIQHYREGQRDTSVGVRLQLWEAGLSFVRDNPFTGLGGGGYKRNMPELQASGALTPLAAQAGEGEMHNQMIAYAVDYGLIGWLALMLVYCGPAAIFACSLRSSDSTVQRAALLGLAFVLAFWMFGLTVETFNLKSTTSTYSSILAMLCAYCAASRHSATDGQQIPDQTT